MLIWANIIQMITHFFFFMYIHAEDRVEARHLPQSPSLNSGGSGSH